jgi:XRE family transcriptional regulator, aerobic/anaerobic benzoate catabolism transcriptional regulator
MPAQVHGAGRSVQTGIDRQDIACTRPIPELEFGSSAGRIETPVNTVAALPVSSAAAALADADATFLAAVGRRVRERRAQRGITRKALARIADVSERYLGQLETGEGNISILLLRRIALALDVALAELLAATETEAELGRIGSLLARLPAHRRAELVDRIANELDESHAEKLHRIALIGLRGAGKTTLGRALARSLGVPFIELNTEVERETGMPASEVFDLYGQAGYRRIERRCLERLIDQHQRVVLSLGGGAVSDDETFDLLLRRCRTVWLKASPEEHMARVLAQGDLRPMAGHADAMDDLKRILAVRDPLYRKAEVVVDTSGQSVEQSLQCLRRAVSA